MATETVFVRGQGGTIFERDVPAEGSLLREVFDEQLAKGELVIVASAHWVEYDGAKQLVETQPDDQAAVEVPPSKWKKAELLNWLTVNDVEHDATATNAVLAELVVGAREWFDAVEALGNQGQS